MKKIHLVDNTIAQDELDALCEWIKTGSQLTKGKLCHLFENEFSLWQGKRYSVFVNSGSSANLLILQSLIEGNYLKNNIIIAPAVSWSTTVAPLMQLGLKVILCDCDRDNLGLDIEHFEQLCREHEPAMVSLVHVLGHASHLSQIKTICQQYDLLMIEDTCEAIGSVYNGVKLGSQGNAGAFSFYYGHHMSTIEGGMVVTDDERLYHLMLSIRSHGWGRDVPRDIHNDWQKNYDIDEVRDLYTFYHTGFNLRSTELNAFLGLSQLKKLNDVVAQREENFKLYANELQDYWQQNSEVEVLSSFAYGVLVKNRLQVYHHLTKAGIESRPLVCGNIGLHPFWIKKFGASHFKNADIIHDYGLYLPNHANLSRTAIERVCKVFKEIAEPYHF